MFEFNEFVVVTIILFLIVLAIVGRASRKTVYWYDWRGTTVTQRPMKQRLVAGVSTFIGLTLLLNGASWVFSWGASSSNTSVKTYDSGVYPTEFFGLTPGESYPMSLGQLGFTSSINVTKAPFYFSLQETSGAAAIVSVTHEDQTYFLEIPVADTVYFQVEDVEPSMKLFFNTGAPRYGVTMGQMQVTRTDTYAPCHSQFTNLLWSCERSSEPISSVEEVETLSQEQLEAGLSYWVTNYLRRAEITLTPEMHDELIGKIG